MTGCGRSAVTVLLVLLAVMHGCNCRSGGGNGTARGDFQLDTVGRLANGRLTEASGLSFSRLRPNVLWVVNDSGHPPFLYAAGLDGEDLGVVRINAPNRDWEDLAGFQADGDAFLIIADVGDNRSVYDTSFLIVVREPESDESGRYDGMSLQPIGRIPFRYEDGPRDCEAVAVDEARRVVLLLSKRDIPPVLYELPLMTTDPPEPLVARRVGVFRPACPSAEATVPRAARPTAMDIDPEGTRIVILTYHAVMMFQRNINQPWEDVLTSSPVIYAPHCLRQGEAVCFSRDGAVIYITGERRPAPLLRLKRLPAAVAETGARRDETSCGGELR